MGKLFRKLFSLGTIVAIIMLLLNHIYLNGYFVNTLGVDKFSTISEGIQVANTGNSHSANGINYDAYEQYNCFNFAMGGQPLIYDYLILKNYSDFINEGAVVFIEVSYFSLYHTITNDDASMLSRYYYFMDPDNIMDYSFKDDFLYHYFPVLAVHPDQITKITKNIFDYYSKKFGDNLRNEQAFVEDVNDAKDMAAQMEKSGRARFEHHYRYYQFNNGFMDESEVEALENIMKLCKKNKWRAVLFTTPCTAQYTDCFPEKIINNVTTYLYDLADRYDATYLDYSKNEDFREDLSLFLDSDHLNPRGASMFTDILIEWCKKEGYLQ